MRIKLHTDPRYQQKPKRLGLFIGLGVAALLFLLLIVTAVDSKNVTGLSNVFGFIVRPIQRGVYTVTLNISNAIYDARDKKDYQLMVSELTEQVAQMDVLEQEIKELQAENQRLTGLLGASETLYADMEVTHARVVGKTPGPWFDEFILDKGRRDGVTRNMIVVNADGVVGRVVEVGGSWSRVMTLIDGDSSVAVMLERTRDNGMLGGTVGAKNDEGMCLLHYLPYSSTVTSGDSVITSGLGGFFPKGLKVGTVLEVGRTSETGETYVLVKTAVDFDHLEDVLLLPAQEDFSEETLQQELSNPSSSPSPEASATPQPSASPQGEDEP